MFVRRFTSARARVLQRNLQAASRPRRGGLIDAHRMRLKHFTRPVRATRKLPEQPGATRLDCPKLHESYAPVRSRGAYPGFRPPAHARLGGDDGRTRGESVTYLLDNVRKPRPGDGEEPGRFDGLSGAARNDGLMARQPFAGVRKQRPRQMQSAFAKCGSVCRGVRDPRHNPRPEIGERCRVLASTTALPWRTLSEAITPIENRPRCTKDWRDKGRQACGMPWTMPLPDGQRAHQ